MRTWIHTLGPDDVTNRTEVYCFGPWGAIINIGEKVQLLPPSPNIQIPDYLISIYDPRLIFFLNQDTIQTKNVDS